MRASHTEHRPRTRPRSGLLSLPELIRLFLLGLMPIPLIAQVPRQAQVWVIKKEFGYTNEIRINNSSPEITVVTLNENQAGPQTDVVGEQQQIIKKSSVWNSRYGFTDYTNWWKYPPETQGITGMMGGLYRDEVTPSIFHQRKPVTCGWIKANAMIDTGAEIKKTKADTRIMLRHISGYGTEKRGVRIAVTAYYYDWMTGSGWVPSGVVPPDQITVLSQRLDCNGQVILKLGSGDFDVTPAVSGNYSFYEFVVTATPARDHHRTWSYHPYLGFGRNPPFKHFYRLDLSGRTEVDGCICDSDPRLAPNFGVFESALFESDSVPVAAELFVYDAPKIVFPKPFDSISLPDYCNIKSRDDADGLLAASFSDVKMVQSMKWGDVRPTGYAERPGRNIIVIESCFETTWMHELGHNVGLDHRDSSANNLMNSFASPTKWKVNRTERNAFEK